jgi:hypothetical protein
MSLYGAGKKISAKITLFFQEFGNKQQLKRAVQPDSPF